MGSGQWKAGDGENYVQAAKRPIARNKISKYFKQSCIYRLVPGGPFILFIRPFLKRASSFSFSQWQRSTAFTFFIIAFPLSSYRRLSFFATFRVDSFSKVLMHFKYGCSICIRKQTLICLQLRCRNEPLRNLVSWLMMRWFSLSTWVMKVYIFPLR